jgi:hypothetical protein
LAGKEVEARLAPARERRAQAAAAAERLRPLGLVSEWHAVYGFEVKSSGSRPGIDPGLLDRLVPILKDMPQVNLRFDQSLTDEQLSSLTQLRHLETLDLTDTAVTDAGLQRLRGCPELECLWLGGCRITDTGIAEVALMPHLRALFLATSESQRANVRVTDAGMLRLKEATELRLLQVPQSISEDTMKELRRALPGIAVYHGY